MTTNPPAPKKSRKREKAESEAIREQAQQVDEWNRKWPVGKMVHINFDDSVTYYTKSKAYLGHINNTALIEVGTKRVSHGAFKLELVEAVKGSPQRTNPKSNPQPGYAELKATAEEMTECVKLALAFLDSLPDGWLGKTVADIGLLNDFYLKSSAALAKAGGGK